MASSSKSVVHTRDDAAEYVDSIMSTQQAVRVGTPGTGRKRNRSAPSPTFATVVKKARNIEISPSSENDASPVQESNPRRALYIGTPTPAPRKKQSRTTEGTGSDLSMELLFDRLAADIGIRFTELNNLIDQLEQGLEQRISNKVAQLLDKRINSELKRLRKDVDAHIENVTDTIKAEVAADIADINNRIKNVGSNASVESDLACNIVVRNLPEHHNENVKEKVTSLMREGCGVREVEIVSAERRRGPQGKPGVVIAKLKSEADKSLVLKNKRKLKNNRRFQDVFIHPDQSKTERLIADNFRTVLSAIKSGNHNLSIRGPRVVKSVYRAPQATAGRQGNIGDNSQRHNNRSQAPNDTRRDREGHYRNRR